MSYNLMGQTYVLLGRPEGSMALGKITGSLAFRIKEIDPSTGNCFLVFRGDVTRLEGFSSRGGLPALGAERGWDGVVDLPLPDLFTPQFV